MGVQMEISRGLRAMLFRDLTPEGRHSRTAVFARLPDAVRKAIVPVADINAETQPLRNTD